MNPSYSTHWVTFRENINRFVLPLLKIKPVPAKKANCYEFLEIAGLLTPKREVTVPPIQSIVKTIKMIL